MSAAGGQSKEALQARLGALPPEQRRALLQQLARRKRASSVSALPHEPRDGRYPLSHAQQRLWVISRLGDAAGAAYNISAAMVFDGPLSAPALEQAFCGLLARHEVLRSRFLEDADGTVWQEPRPTADWHLDACDLTDAADPIVALQDLAETDATRAFDLSGDWLIRVRFCKLGARLGTALVLTLHHIICDGVSIPLLMDELARQYEAVGAGRAVDSAPAARQYRDYVKWLSGEWASGTLEKPRHWWQGCFEHLPEPLPLPLDYPRAAIQSYAGGLVRHVIPAAILQPFETLCASHGCSLFMGVTALTQILLARYCRHTDIVMGTPVAGRIHPALEEMPGLFVNTAVLRRTVDLQVPFREQLLAVRANVLGAFEHQAYPFDRLVEDLQIERDMSRSPLFDVMLGLQEEPAQTLCLDGHAGRMVPPRGGMAKVDLTFHCERCRNGDMFLDLEYASALFAPERIRRMGELWEQLMAAVVQAPADLPAGKLAWLSDAAYRQVVQAFNQTRRPYPSQTGLAAAFRAQGARTPDYPAIYFAGEELTYRQVDAASDQLAVWLRQRLDLGREVPVAFMLARSPAMLICMLAIVKAGAAYLPLNPDTPSDRLCYILEDAGAGMLLTDAAGMQQAAAWNGRITDLDQVLPSLAALHAPSPSHTHTLFPAPEPPPPPGGRLAYIMYTSGSTGEPKGTLIEQQSVLRLVLGTDYHQIQPGERVLQTGSPAFDAATFEIWGPLLNGGCCCLPAGQSLLEISEFDSLLLDCGAETAFLTTGLFNQLSDYNPAAFRLLKTALTGGEKVSPAHVNRVLETAPQLRLLHVYGPTENTTFASYYEVKGQHAGDIPIGRAIANSTLYVLDDFLQPVPIGVPGEIFCGGDGLARGYLGRPDLTATQFLPDPFSDEPGQRLYRTGDIGAWDADGNIRFLGRHDHQVKIRGFRIELGEVEAYLRQVPGVDDALVIARPAGGTHEMVAYLVAGDAAPAEAAVRERLRANLPVYMVPTHMVFLSAFPLNPSGKVDRRKLPAPEAQALADTAIPVALPMGTVEEQMAVHWRSVLGLQSIDRHANFFSLGGDSIKAIQIVARSRGDGLHFKLADLFQHSTLAALAPHVQQQTQREVPAVVTLATEASLSPVQQWWLETVGVVDHFNQATLLQSREPIDLETLEACLARLLERHPALRLRLVGEAGGGDFRQAVASDVPCRVQWLDVSAEPPATQLRLQTEALQAAQRSLSLRESRLLQVVVVRRSDGDRVGLVIHHWAVDGVSWRILLAELETLYAGAPLPELTVPYTNWSLALADCADHPDVTRHMAYWKRQVDACNKATGQRFTPCSPSSADAGTLAMPDGGQGSAELSPARTRVARTIERQRVVAMQQAVESAWGLNMQELLLAALVRSWRLVLGSNPVALMMEGHGRGLLPPDLAVERTVGWFTSLYPFCLDQPDVPLDQSCRLVKDALRGVPDRGTSYGVLRYLSPSGETREALACKPDVSFNYLGDFADVGSADGIFSHCEDDAGDDHAASCPEPFLVDLMAWQTEEKLELVIQSGLAAEGAETWIDAWQQELGLIADAAAAAVPRLSMQDITLGGIDLASLDALLDHHQAGAEAIEDILPLTPMQAGMYYQVVVAGDTTAYTDQVSLRIQTDLDHNRFRQAWEALCRRHQGLRVAIWHAPLDVPVQVIRRDRLPELVLVDGRQWQDPACELAAWRQRERVRGFDLATDPLLRLTVIQLDECEYEWIMHLHHIAMDGWSSAIILRDLEILYREPERRLSPAVALRAYFRWQQAVGDSSDRAYWQEMLGDYEHGADVPSLQPVLPEAAVEPAFHRFRIGGPTWLELRQWSEEHQVTINSIFQALWGVMLCHWSGHWDVVYGATVSGRTVPVDGVEDVVGMLINTLPVRIRMAPDDRLQDVVRHAQAGFRASQEHARLGLADIQRLAPAGGRLVRHTLVFENYPGDDTAAGADPEKWHFETVDIFDPMHFEFGVLVAPGTDHMDVRFVVDGNRYSPERLQAIAAAFTHITERAVDDPTLPVTDLLAGLSDSAGMPWVVSATFNADLLLDGLRAWETAFGRAAACVSTGFDQVLQALTDPGSVAHVPMGCRHVILFRPSDWARGRYSIEENLDLLVDAVGAYVRAVPRSELLLVACPDETQDAMQLATRLQRRLARLPPVRVLDASAAIERYQAGDVQLPDSDSLGGIPYTESFFAALAAWVYRQSEARRRAPVKVFAVDADQTLWGGIVGEDGVDGIHVAPCHRKLGALLAAARQAGKLLCLVTKNNPEDIEEVFARRDDLPLRRDQFTAVYAGWEPKPQRLRRLAQDLNIGLDSVVFLDDSPLECESVRRQCPEVLTVQLPDEATRDTFLDHLWLFDTAALTNEDRDRAGMMATEQQRQALAGTAASFQDFLRGLAVAVDLHPMRPDEIERVAQLTQRTNQFHTMTRRFRAAELETWCAQAGRHVWTASVRDRFGDYGLTGVLMLELTETAIKVVNMLLSCRVLGRGVEHTLLREVGQRLGMGVTVCFKESGRNRPARAFLEKADATVSEAGDGEVLHYHFPAEVLAELVADGGADEKMPAAPAQEASVVPERSLAQSWGRFYEWIAAERNTADALLGDLVRMRGGGQLVHQRSGSPLVTDGEHLLGRIWCELLGVDHVWRESNFFALGGHSLLAVMLLARLQHRHGMHLSLDALQSAATLSDMAALLQQAGDAGRPPLVHVPDADAYPLSHAQRRLWMIEQMRGEGPSPFHMAACLAFDVPVSAGQVEQAMEAILDRHEALRSVIEAQDGAPIQRVVPAIGFRVKTLADTCTDATFAEACAPFIHAPFDLAAPPLIRIGMGTLASGATGLCLVMHHIISDGWSVGVLAHELTERLAGRPQEPLPLQYRDYAAWQGAYLASPGGEADRQFWLGELADPPATLQLPIRPAARPPIKRSEGADVRCRIPLDTWSQVKRLCEGLQVTPYTGLLAAMQILLSRYSGQDSFVTGTPVAGRQHPDLEPLIGFFVNVLPIRANVQADQPLETYLKNVGRHVNQVLAHQDYPFDVLVDELALARDMSRAPLFDVLVVLQNAAMDMPEYIGVRARSLVVPSRTSQYDLVCNAFEDADGLAVVLEYDIALFDDAGIQRFAGHLLALFTSMAAQPGRLVRDLQMLDDDALQQILAFEGAPVCPLPAVRVMPGLLAQQAQLRPTAVAMRCDRQTWTYAALAAAMEAAAAQIAAQVEAGAVVGVIGVPSAANVIAMLGILRAGCVYLPLDPESPAERLRFMIADSGIRLLIPAGDAGRRAAALAPDLAVLDGNRLGLSLPQAVEPPAMPHPDEAAYLIYTSGSTGKPKAVAVSHQAFCCMIAQQIEAFDMRPDDIVGQFASHAFDASLSEFFLAFHSGACLQLPPPEVKQSIEAFLGWLRETQVTVLTLPPAFLRGLQQADLAPVRVLITAGEAADPAAAAYYGARLQYINAYGPTETAVCATTYRMTDRVAGSGRVPIGRPLPCTRLLLLDPAGQRVPVGVPGELYIGGPTVALGYANRPALTPERFVQDPGGIEAGRCYRTGDVCMWLPDGNLVFLHRIDNQCKIRGYRIEPGEVEVALRACAGVRDAVVVPDGQGGLPAWYAAAADVTPDALRAELARHLPTYMLPLPLIRMDALPRTVNGKLDRANLPPAAMQEDYEAPGSPQEQALARAWQLVLSGPPPGRRSDFFHGGGDSIKALRILSQLRDSGWHASLKDLFASPVLADAALYLQPVAARGPAEPLAGNVPLLPIQHWFFATHRDSPLAHFNQAVVLTCRERVETDRLAHALQQLCVMHDSLRARFRLTEQGWIQAIDAAETFDCPVRVEDWSTLSEAEWQGRLAALDHELNTGFCLENGQLLQTVLIRSADRDRLVLVAHHLVTDWVSWRILIEDLERLYAGDVVASVPHTLRQLAAEAGRGVAAARCRELQAACKLALADWNLPVGCYGDVCTQATELDAGATVKLREALQRKHACGLQDGLLFALVQALATLTGLDAIPVMLDSHGRDGVDPVLCVDRTAGWFTSLLPVLLPGPRLPESSLEGVRERTRAALLDYGRYLSCIPDEPVPALASFNFLGSFDAPAGMSMFKLASDTLNEVIAPAFMRDCPIAVSGHVIGDCLHWQVTAAGPVLDRVDLADLAHQIERVLVGIEHTCGDSAG